MAPLRSVILGTGFMGDVHARAVRAAGGRVAAVVSRQPERATAAAQRFGADRAATSLAEALAAGDVDLVHVCTPNAAHVDQVREVLAAGLPVVCEKPLATSSADAAALLAEAEDRGVVHAVPFAYRFHSSAREARERIRRGDAGAIRLVHGTYLQDWLARPDDTNWRVDAEVGGASRAFGDIGVHFADLVEFVTGQRITEVFADLLRVPRSAPSATEDGVTLLFRTDGGALGSGVISQVSPGRKNRLWLSVDGAEASYEFAQETPDFLWIGGLEANTVLPRAAGGTVHDGRYDLVPAGHPQGYQDCFTMFVRDVHDAIGGTPPDGLPTFADGLRAARLTEAVLRSADERQWTAVGT